LWKRREETFSRKAGGVSEIVVYLHSEIIKFKKMDATKTKSQNLILRLLQFKREMRECVQKGADPEEMKRIASKYGFTFATPV
jgi:pyruvate-formate lyase